MENGQKIYIVGSCDESITSDCEFFDNIQDAKNYVNREMYVGDTYYIFEAKVTAKWEAYIPDPTVEFEQEF